MHIEAAAEHTKGGVKEVEKAANTYLGKKATAKARSRVARERAVGRAVEELYSAGFSSSHGQPVTSRANNLYLAHLHTTHHRHISRGAGRALLRS